MTGAYKINDIAYMLESSRYIREGRCSYISGNSMPVSADSTMSMGISCSIIKSSMAVLSLPPDRLTA